LCRNNCDAKVIGQGHTRPKIDLESWRRHRSPLPLRSSSFAGYKLWLSVFYRFRYDCQRWEHGAEKITSCLGLSVRLYVCRFCEWIFVKFFNPLIATLKPQSNGPSYSSKVIGTLDVDGWAVTFGTARRGSLFITACSMDDHNEEKRTERNWFVGYASIEATDRHEASRGLSVTAGLLVICRVDFGNKRQLIALSVSIVHTRWAIKMRCIYYSYNFGKWRPVLTTKYISLQK